MINTIDDEGAVNLAIAIVTRANYDLYLSYTYLKRLLRSDWVLGQNEIKTAREKLKECEEFYHGSLFGAILYTIKPDNCIEPDEYVNMLKKKFDDGYIPPRDTTYAGREAEEEEAAC